jgi:hypothetical protein
VHFHGHWWWAKEVGGAPDNPNGTLGPVNRFLRDNLEAFTFARTDWEYVSNTFVFIAKTGYHFLKSKGGAASCQMVGVGADAVHDCVIVDGIVSWWTLLITNGQFASDGVDPTAVGVQINGNSDPAANGPVRLVNCSILSQQCVVSHNPTMTSLSGCFFNSWGSTTGHPLIEADNGKLQVLGCTFDNNNGGTTKHVPSIALRNGLKRAIVSENMGQSGVEIINEIGDKAILSNNEPYEGKN